MNLFVTGTDTGVGKTIVSALLALKLGFHYWKPIQTGAGPDSDSEFLRRTIGVEKVYGEVYSLTHPSSPHLAAHLEGVEITLQAICGRAPPARTVIEGAGGVLVPLNKDTLMIDLIAALRCPVILVARSVLGTINHTLLTLEALRARHVEPVAVVLVGEPDGENRKAIETFGKVTVIAEIPILKNTSRNTLVQACNLIDMEKITWMTSTSFCSR